MTETKHLMSSTTINIRNFTNTLSNNNTRLFGFKQYFNYRQIHISNTNPSSFEENIHSAFSKAIDSKYVYNKNKPILESFASKELRQDIIVNRLKSRLDLNSVYTVFIKVRYNIDDFFMLGNQFGFIYQSVDKLSQIHDILASRLDIYMEDYNLTLEDIVYVQVIVRKKDKALLSEFTLAVDNIPKSDITSIKKSINIPISINEDSLGKCLEVDVINGFITNIKLVIDGKVINFLSLIKEKSSLIRENHMDNITSFDSSYKFYIITDENKNSYVLAIKSENNENIDKIRYSLSGVLVNRVRDIIYDGFVKRISGEKALIIRDGKVIKAEQNIKLKAIPKPIDKTGVIEDKNVGVLDIETYTAKDGIIKVHALGFKTILDREPVMYYISENLDSDGLVLNLINELLRDRYSNMRFYCHNLGGYDIVFILKTLYLHNEDNPDKNSHYKISLTMKNNKILKCVITRKKAKITLIDSFPILPRSLKDLGKDFQVTTLKSDFPHKFSLEDNLFYVGVIPSFNDYINLNIDTYNEIFKLNWSFKDETLLYLKNDLVCHFEVMVKVNKQVHYDYDIDLKDSLTVSSLAARIFLKKYYDNNIPTLNKASLYNDIKQAYYGGITEVYRPYGQNLYYYDVNSLYPYVAHQAMPGMNCSKMTFYEKTMDISNLFGFFYCKIDSPHNIYLGILPLRKDSGLEFPLGSWKGWYFSEELKFAKENGYSITVLKGYNFNKQYRIFDSYIKDVYEKKANPINVSQKNLAKSLLNNLLGRFGISLDKPVTKVVSDKNFDDISLKHKILNYKNIAEDKVMVSYTQKLDYDIIKGHGLDITKVLNQTNDKENESLNITSVAISAAITSYARIYITRLKLDILNRLGGNIYYSDTDSIVTDVKLPDAMVHSSDLGKLKLEHFVKRGIFISGKLYTIINEFNKVIVKAKGFDGSSLKYQDFEVLLQDRNIYHAVKVHSKANWSIGHVQILRDKYIINSNHYLKREKLLDRNGYWVNTKPKIVNMINRELVLYHNHFKLIVYKDNKDKQYLIMYQQKGSSSIVYMYNSKLSSNTYNFNNNMNNINNNKKLNKSIKTYIPYFIVQTILFFIIIPLSLIGYLSIKYEEDSSFIDEDIQDNVTDLDSLTLDEVELPEKPTNLSRWDKWLAFWDNWCKNPSYTYEWEEEDKSLDNKLYIPKPDFETSIPVFQYYQDKYVPNLETIIEEYEGQPPLLTIYEEAEPQELGYFYKELYREAGPYDTMYLSPETPKLSYETTEQYNNRVTKHIERVANKEILEDKAITRLLDEDYYKKALEEYLEFNKTTEPLTEAALSKHDEYWDKEVLAKHNEYWDEVETENLRKSKDITHSNITEIYSSPCSPNTENRSIT